MMYDSTKDTLDHIEKVHDNIKVVRHAMQHRARNHDRSKLSGIEKECFDRITPLLKETVFGSEEYRSQLASMKPAIEEHYRKNSHHPEHYENGISGMDLIDIIEMVCDWKAAALRNKGDGQVKLDLCKERFGIEDQLFSIIKNTLDRWETFKNA